MPYVKQEARVPLDILIDNLAANIALQAHDHPEETAYAGLLNYAITRLAMSVIDKRFGKLRYGIIATTCGVLANVRDEFYRRMAAPYEDKQVAKNGDVDLYDAYAKLTATIRA